MLVSRKALALITIALVLDAAHAWRPGFMTWLAAGRAVTTDPPETYPGYPGGNTPTYPGWGPPSPGGSGGDTPAYPGWGPSPPAADELPLTNGMVINLKSHVLGKFCNVAPATAPVPYALTCEYDTTPSVITGMLLLGTDFTTNKIYDGSKVQLKSQADNKLCSVGPEEEGFQVTCNDLDATDTSSFVIRRSTVSSDLYTLSPGFLPSHHCYPNNTAGDHTAKLTRDESPEPVTHNLRCSGRHEGDNVLFEITQAPAWGPTSAEADQGTAGTASTGSYELGFPGFPGFPFPGAPSPAGPPGPAPEPALPFKMGSSIQLSTPDLPDLFCDVKDGGVTRQAPGAKPSPDEKLPVLCDRLGPEGPGSQFIPIGFLVLTDDPIPGPLLSGSKMQLSNMDTKKACRREPVTGGVLCDADKSDPEAQWQVYLAESPKPALHHSRSGVSGVLAWLWGLMTGSEADDTRTEIHLLHVASDLWCGADLDDAHDALVCLHDSDRHRPRLLVKVPSSPWPPA